MYVKRVLSAALSVFTVVSVASTAPAQAATAPVVITPGQAAAVFASYTTTLNKANSSYDTALLDTLEGGSSRQISDADYRISQQVGYGTYQHLAHLGSRYVMPRQTGYPALFVVLTHDKWGSQPTDTYTAALLFQKGSANSGWMLTSDIGFAPKDVPAFAVDKAGYLPTLAASTLADSPAAVYRSLLTSELAAEQGRKPSPAWVDNAAWKTGMSQPASSVADQSYSFSSTHLAPVCVAAVHGALCFASTTDALTRSLTTAEQAAGTRWVVDTMDEQYDSAGVAQGNYITLRTVQQRQLAIVVPKKKSATKLVVVSEYDAPISGTGTMG